MTIMQLLGEIERGSIVLPAIQRDFVWDEDKITKLFDSLMRGYPIGIVLLWDTFKDIDHRKFLKDYQPDIPHIFEDNPRKKHLKLVLDGQQRLQALYLALNGSYEGRQLYLNILSGYDGDDFKEEKYEFFFLKRDEAEEGNNENLDYVKGEGDDVDWESVEYSIRVKDIIKMGHQGRMALEDKIAEDYSLPPDERLRIRVNMGRLVDAIAMDGYILKWSVIDEGKMEDDRSRKSESDVLEAFFRVNREGTPLARSDLIFSLLKLQWRDSAVRLPDFVRDINEGNYLDITNDFVIRCLYAVSGLGTRFDLDRLRKKSNVDLIMRNFDEGVAAISAAVDFVTEECHLRSEKLISSNNNLIPLIYYLYHAPNHQVPQGQVEAAKKSVYLFSWVSPFSRYADSRPWKFIRNHIQPRVEQNDYTFPLREGVKWVYDYHRFSELDADMLGENTYLTHHLIQGRNLTGLKYQGNAPEIDHIFPKALLSDRYEWSEINHVANFWILARSKNRQKSDSHPKDYFADVVESEMKRALIERDLLDLRKYRRFLRERTNLILKRIRKELNLSESDYNYRILWPEEDEE